MKKKFLLILLSVMCIGTFMPKEVFAFQKAYQYSQNVNYRFFVKDANGNNIEGLSFKLYDKTGTFLFNSSYNEIDKYYYFDYYSEDSFDSLYPSFFTDLNNIESDSSIISTYRDSDRYFNSVLQRNIFLNKGFCHPAGYLTTVDCNGYSLIPFILEEKNLSQMKKIVFGSFHFEIWPYGIIFYDYDFTLVNNESDYRWDYNVDDPWNLAYMRNAIYDYNDELWEQLNSEPIASSEMQYDNSDTDLSSPKLITFKTNNDKAIYSKYKSNVKYRFKVKNGNGMNFKLHDISNTFNFSSLYDKDSDTYSIVDNSSDSDYQDGIKEFSKIIIDEVKNGNFSGLANKYKSITSDRCSESSCNIYTYIPLVLEGENKDNYAKQIVLGLVDIQYRQENGNDYYDIGLSVYNNTCDLLSSDIDVSQSELINLSRAIEKDYSNNLINQYSDGSIALEDIYDDVDVNTLKDEYCNDIPVISLKQNPKTWNNGIIILIGSLIVVIVSSVCIIKRKNVKL